MNQPASKEPSMDEILSSIRQIIASDDEEGAGETGKNNEKNAEPAAEAAVAEEAAFEPAGDPVPEPVAEAETTAQVAEAEPLALSPEQIVEEDTNAGGADTDLSDFGLDDADGDAGAPAAVISNDIAFEDDGGGDETALEHGAEPAISVAAPEARSALAPRAPVANAARPAPQPEAPSPLPDPALSGDIAASLLEPATNAAARQAFGQLSALGLEANGRTVEDLIRELLRPMLKGWLDENLPSIVERLVQKEIDRVSRGDR
jgi:uncharacterized protein